MPSCDGLTLVHWTDLHLTPGYDRRFFEDPAGTRVEFDIDFAFKTRLLEGLLSRNFEHAVDRLMGCFEDRAKALYG